jgi:hypothetical protein
MEMDSAVTHCINLEEIASATEQVQQQSVEKLRRAVGSATLADIEAELEWLSRALDDLRARCREILDQLGGVPEVHNAIAKLVWDPAEYRTLIIDRKTQKAMVRLDSLSQNLGALNRACRFAVTAIALNLVQGRD